jgi:hypothetical protein
VKAKLMAIIDTIRQAANAQPFRPFTVHMVDGTDYVVEHPDFLKIPKIRRPREVYFYTLEPGDRESGDYNTYWINLNLVQSIIDPTTNESQQPDTNGDQSESG